mgnify:CR=1 FL=1
MPNKDVYYVKNANGKFKAGNHKLDLSAAGIQNGFYICIISTNSNRYFKKIIKLSKCQLRAKHMLRFIQSILLNFLAKIKIKNI